MKARAEESERLIDYAFREFENVTLAQAGDTLSTADVWLGAEDSVPLQAPKDLIVTVPRRGAADLKATVIYDGPVPAPIRKGDVVGKLNVSAPGIPPVEVPLVAGADVDRRGPVGRAFAALGAVVHRAIP
jgi:D-alanyl-D-alanine carboxypeptidase (penicillin-binding protein 5/6)